MAHPRVEDQELIRRLLCVFRVHGFEGSSLSRISEATGLQRASLYHRFPGGKLEMAHAVLDHTSEWISANVLVPLEGEGSPKQRLRQVAQALTGFYLGGTAPCLIDAFSFATQDSSLRPRIAAGAQRLIDGFAAIAREAGATPAAARRRAEDALISIQGSLVVSRASGDTAHFERALRELPARVAGDS